MEGIHTEYTDRASKWSGPQTVLAVKDLGKDLGSRLASVCVVLLAYDVDTFHLTFFLLPTKHVLV